jgi:hypothetical protein
MPNKLNKINRKYSKDCKTASDRRYETEKLNTNKVDKKARNLVNKTKLSLEKLKSKKKKRLLKNAKIKNVIIKPRNAKKLTICLFIANKNGSSNCETTACRNFEFIPFANTKLSKKSKLNKKNTSKLKNATLTPVKSESNI